MIAMNYILFDNFRRNYLLPLTFIRPSADIRIGIMTIREKWEHFLKAKTSTLTEDYLQAKFPIIKSDRNIIINGTICPTGKLVEQIKKLKKNEALVSDRIIIAMYVNAKDLTKWNEESVDNITEIETITPFIKINNTWDIFDKNGEELIRDFNLLIKGRKSEEISITNLVLNEKNIFIEKGAHVEFTTLNASKGPIYIGKNAEIMEGALIRGPFALGENSVVKMGAKIYGPVSLGPNSKVGGEMKNVVFFGNSNKAHEGYLGDAVIGEWCNLGADTNNSNLKNTYEEVKMWNYAEKKFVKTGLQFCGLIMGDHSKCGINTMFNTGTVIGINANIFGSGFQRNFIPSFSWGGTAKMEKYNLLRAKNTAKAVMKRKGVKFDDIDNDIFDHIYTLSLKDKFV